MYKLYGAKYARSLMCEMVMIDGEIPYELMEIDMLANEHRTLAFLAVNPAGQVPVLITPEGDTLVQTAAINLYLSDKHKLHDYAPALDEAERGTFVSGLFYLVGELEPIIKRFLYPHRYALQPEDSKAVYAQALEAAQERLVVMERRLALAGPFYLGDRFSLVDLTMSYWAADLDRRGSLNGLPHVRKTLELVWGRPKLRPMFDKLRDWRNEYAVAYAAGRGVT
jgi:glutathione S-transferase